MSAMERTTRNSYWDRKTPSPELMGVYPMGTGCEIEIPYRHYWELQTILPFLPDEQFSMLELACGAGRWAFSLAPRLTSYLGVDISAPQIEIAQKKKIERGLTHLEFRTGDALNLEIPPHSFDVIAIGSVSMYLNDTELHTLLERVRAGLKPGGLIFEHITTIVGESTYIRHDDIYYAVYRTNQDFINIIEQHGFCFKHAKRSYSFLRGARALWESPELGLFLRWGMENEPEKTFDLMKAWSEAITSSQGPYIYEKDKTYDHQFFIFTT